MRKCSTSHVSREMQIKTMKYHYTPKSQTLTIPNTSEDVEQQVNIQPLLARKQNGCDSLGDTLEIFCTTKHPMMISYCRIL
jgi:hypothetical protein